MQSDESKPYKTFRSMFFISPKTDQRLLELLEVFRIHVFFFWSQIGLQRRLWRNRVASAVSGGHFNPNFPFTRASDQHVSHHLLKELSVWPSNGAGGWGRHLKWTRRSISKSFKYSSVIARLQRSPEQTGRRARHTLHICVIIRSSTGSRRRAERLPSDDFLPHWSGSFKLPPRV